MIAVPNMIPTPIILEYPFQTYSVSAIGSKADIAKVKPAHGWNDTKI